ncbi:MAG: MEDS domain-containing protein [Candidatus Nitrosocosmicus sp.]
MSNLIFQNDNNTLYKDPLKFIDTLDSSKHIVLYYENPKAGKKIQFRFIRNGLLKGETCIYTTHDNDTNLIEFEMVNDSIDVEDYNKRGLLKIFKIPDIMKHPEGVLIGAQEVIDTMFSDITPPFRLVIRMIDKVNTAEQIKANLAIEQYYHSKFDRFDGLVLCPYDVSRNPTNTNGKWVETVLENHHSAIFITGTTVEGIVFDMQ